VEHLDVLIVGAGLSGIGAAHHIRAACPWASYAILEARDSIGGTWDLFRYPGIRSDSDMFTLGYSFRPWDGEKAIADGASILRYIRDTAAEEGIDRAIRFGHKVVRAGWSTEQARWHVTVEHTRTGEIVELTAGFLISCTGYYRYDRGHTPEFPGTARYRGTIVHPQHWPDDLDHAGKRVVVIGSGATAVTLVPALAETAEHVTMLQRSPTYIVSMPARDPIADVLRKVLPRRWSGPVIRWFKALTTQGSYQLSRRRPELMKKLLRKGVERHLPDGYDIDTHFSPRYDPWDQRLCLVPDGDLFEAIKAGRASMVTDRIETFTEDGVLLGSGDELAADIVVTATGLEMLFLGGIDLTVDRVPVSVPNKLTYKGMMLEGVPNLAIAFGYTNASWTLKCDLTCDYVTRLLNHMRATGLRQAMPVNHDAEVEPRPLLSLTSGYVQRAADRFPKQGSRFPWQVHQSYLKDYRALKRSSIDDGAMEFSNPAPVGASAPGR
jgi:monooxygenase